MSDPTVRLRAAIDYLRRTIDGYDSTFETAEEIAAGAIDLQGIGPAPATEGHDDHEADRVVASDYVCSNCGETMARWEQFDEYQHDTCGGLVIRAAKP